MNFQSLNLKLQLDFSTIPILENIQSDKRFVAWNREKYKEFNEVRLYRNSNFRLPFGIQLIHQGTKDEDRDDLTEPQTKNYKKKKISKVDKFHLIEPKQSKKQKKTQVKKKKMLLRDLRARTQQTTRVKRNTELKEKKRKYIRRSQIKENTGKKVPKQQKSPSQQSKYFRKTKNSAEPQRKNNHMMGYHNTSQILSESRSTRKQLKISQQQIQEQQQNEEENSSFVEHSYSKKSKPKKHKSYKSDIKKKQLPEAKPSYLLQQANRSKILRQKFKEQVLNEVPGRRQEAERIFELILNSENGSSTPICLHGNTGCGKTSLITKMLHFILKEFPVKFSTAYLNCMSMWSVNHVYSGMLYKLFGFKQKRSQRALNNLFQQSQLLASRTKSLPSEKNLSQEIQKTKIIVLDEIDHFIKDQTFIYNLLEWTHIKNSKIILIMISNILDLSVNLSAKIQSRMKFQSLVFKPYSSDAIQQIFHHKYPDAKRVFEPQAVAFMCKKVASINSDIRLLQKIYEDVLIQWMEANGLQKRHNEDENQRNHANRMDVEGSDDESEEHASPKKKQTKKHHNPKSLNVNIKQLSTKKKITIKDLQGSLFLTGSLKNDQLQQILRQYDVLLNVLHHAEKKQEVSYQILNKTYLKQRKMPTSQEIFLQMCELKDMGLIELKESTRNCDVTFQGFGVKISRQLHLMCPEDNK